MTTIYLGVGAPDKPLMRALTGARVGMFVSRLYYRNSWKRNAFLDSIQWGLDSGAFSGFTDLDEYIVDVEHARSRANPPTDLFALDVIGDWRASLCNYETLRNRGFNVIPTWHVGSPEHVLVTLTREYPKIAIGGIVAQRLRGAQLVAFLVQVFSRIWPARVHGFGVLAESALQAVPFHTVDGTGWLAARRFGSWAGSAKAMYVAAQTIDMAPQVRHYENLQERLRARWAKELAEL